MKSPIVIGIAGGSASGKTTLLRRLKESFPDDICFLSHDSYYRAHDEMTYEERTHLNYDCPEAFETDLLIRHLEQLKKGEGVDVPVYDFTVHNRSSELTRVEPAKVILVEGILIFADPLLRDQMDIRIFVDADADVRLLRRIKRDMNKRGRSLESITAQYLGTVKPMHDLYVEPSKQYAHMIVPEGGKNIRAAEMIESYLRSLLSDGNEDTEG